MESDIMVSNIRDVNIMTFEYYGIQKLWHVILGQVKIIARDHYGK